MQPVEFLRRVEPILRSLFNALHEADLAADRERASLDPAARHYLFEFERWSNLEDADEQRLNLLCSQARKAHEALVLVDTTAAAAAGAILQTAKQCITLASPLTQHGVRGRLVGTQHLSTVIWHARNQALHFDEGLPKNQETMDSIKKLADEMNLEISSLPRIPRSLAKDIIRILGWNTYEIFAKDIYMLVQEA